jgi:hypothetical protein
MTETDVANMALGLLDEAQITSLAQNSTAGRLVNLHFAQTRRAELAKYAWIFAMRSSSSVGTEVENGSMTMQFDMPTDAVRILPLTYDGEPSGIPINWRQTGIYIYTDQDTPQVIRYIKDITDPDEWSPLFVEVMAAALAVKIALPLTHKQAMIQVARQAYADAVATAQRQNAFQRSGRLDTNSWLIQRGDYRWTA